MATKTFEELKQLAVQIRDEKTNKQNTATRIGTQMLEHLNKLEQDYYDKTATDEELKQRDEKLTELSSVTIPNLSNQGGLIDNPTDNNFNINTMFNSGIYTLRYSNGTSENLPADFPTSTVSTIAVDKFIIIEGQGNSFTFTTQIMICDRNRGCYYRWSLGNKTWNPWVRLDYTDQKALQNVLNNKFYQDKDYIDNPTESTFSIDNQFSHSIFRVRYSNGNGDNLPNNYPISNVSTAYIDLFITSYGSGASAHTFAYQLFIADKNRGVYYRWRSASAWNPWVRLDYVAQVTTYYVTPDKNLLSVLLQHLTDGATIIVEPGNYDILQMYKDVYGEAYFETYEGYNSGATSIGMGLPIKNGLKLICSPNAIFTCNYDGSNPNVTEYFSAFNIWDGGEIVGLNLTCGNLRYGIHDDSHVDGKYHLHRIENCYIHSTTRYTIGFGFGKCDRYEYKNNYLKCDSLNYDLYGHNNGGDDSQSFMEFSGNYLTKSVLFQNYGASVKKSIVLVHP